MRWHREDEAKQGNWHIEEISIYYDPAIALRLDVLRDLLDGKAAPPDDPRLNAFDDPYVPGEAYDPRADYKQPFGDSGLESMTHAHAFGEMDPIEASLAYSDQWVRNAESYFQDGDPIEATMAESDRFMREAARVFEEANLPFVELALRYRHDIPPQARILYYGVRLVNYNQGNG